MTQLTAGHPEPLGARFDGKGVNFTLFSAHAERVELTVSHRGYLARVPVRWASGDALRFSRTRSVATGSGALV